jgi:quinol monooxygenase YgiN
VWIFEIWDDKEAHDFSLKDDRVHSLISEALALMDGVPHGIEVSPEGTEVRIEFSILS